MNQILAVENKNKKKEKTKKVKTGKPLEIEGIIKFFAGAIIVFGITFIGKGSYAIYKNIDDRKPANIPIVNISRINDKAIINVKNNIEISKLVYSWDDGQESAIPIGDTEANEEVLLLGYDSVLNITIEDVNGKQVKYHKAYKLTGVDITKPSIEIETKDGSNKMTITVKDETALSYISYQWEQEDEVIIEVDQNNKKETRKEIDLTPGSKKIKIIAKDENGNIEEIEKEIVASTSKPKMSIKLTNDRKKISVLVEDKDGIKDVIVNLNGKEYSRKDIGEKKIELGYLELREGNNTISVTVTNVSGYTESGTTELQYNP